MSGRRAPAAGRRHFGNVRRLPSGRWQASYWHEGHHHTAPTTFTAKADALAYLSGMETDLRRGTWVDPRAGDVTLAEYADSWLGTRPTLRPRTVELYRHLLDAHILPELGRYPLARLQPQAIRSWNAGVAGRLPSTAAKAYRLLSTICRSAVTDELIVRSPCRLNGAGTEHAPERPTVSVAEVEALTAAMPEHLRLLIPLAVWCSLRRGELLALRRQDVDETLLTIRVERSMHQQSDGAIVYGPPKSAAGTRTVSYPDAIAAAISCHLAHHVPAEPSALLFRGVKGGPLRLHVLQAAWSAARSSIGRPELHLHDLRHTGATFTAIVGATTKELMARLGHASPAAALRYQHATSERDVAIARALSGLADPRS